jgi:hypothetical protein
MAEASVSPHRFSEHDSRLPWRCSVFPRAKAARRSLRFISWPRLWPHHTENTRCSMTPSRSGINVRGDGGTIDPQGTFCIGGAGVVRLGTVIVMPLSNGAENGYRWSRCARRQSHVWPDASWIARDERASDDATCGLRESLLEQVAHLLPGAGVRFGVVAGKIGAS